MKVIRFSEFGTSWEKYARAHYPGLFRVMAPEHIRQTYGMNVNNDGSIALVSGDAVWMGKPTADEPTLKPAKTAHRHH